MQFARGQHRHAGSRQPLRAVERCAERRPGYWALERAVGVPDDEALRKLLERAGARLCLIRAIDQGGGKRRAEGIKR